MPAIDLISVDLPAPLSPTSAITSPARTSKSTSLSAWTEPNDFVIPRSSSVGVSAKVTKFRRSGRGAPQGAPTVTQAGTSSTSCTTPLQMSLFFMKPDV